MRIRYNFSKKLIILHYLNEFLENKLQKCLKKLSKYL